MNDRADFEARISTLFTVYADRMPVEVDALALTASVANDRARGRWSFLTRQPAWLLVCAALALLVLGAALAVGSFLLRPRATLGGGGLMAISQADVPEGLGAGSPSMHVFTLDPATNTREPITSWQFTVGSADGAPTWARWSPDRKHALLFDVDGSVRGIVDVASHRLTELSPLPGLFLWTSDSEMAWSPTSDRIAGVVSVEPLTGIADHVVIIDVDGRLVGELPLPTGTRAGEPRWSPDGSAIALAGCVPCNDDPNDKSRISHLLIVPIDGSAVRVVLEPAASYSGPTWSPDGSTIAYMTPAGIATMDVASGRQTLLTHGHDGSPTWSPNGHRIAFGRYVDDFTPVGIYLVDVDGTHLTRLTEGPDQKPDWSPDGTSLVFGRQGDSDAYPSVWVVAADGGEPRLLVKNATSDW